MAFDRVILLVIDACGVGELPDADEYGDSGAATLPNIASAVGGLNMPTCQSLGLGNVAEIEGVAPNAAASGCYGRMASKAAGKDSTTGHWELAGVRVEKPFPTFPNGFPRELVERFESESGYRTIGNCTASGTQIIDELGEEHLSSGALILYTSADSVFQLAGHDRIIPHKKLWEVCQIARDICTGEEFGVARVIARPFAGEPGFFLRTEHRRDFSLPPAGRTILDDLVDSGKKVFAVGKIWDLYAARGMTDRIKTGNNTEVMASIRQMIRYDYTYDLIFANCVDFDQLWGHRNDEKRFANGLADFDVMLENFPGLLRENDLMLITADHGCDPTIKSSTDHTREYVPLLAFGPQVRAGQNLGTRESLADVAATLAELFALDERFGADSFLGQLAD